MATECAATLAGVVIVTMILTSVMNAVFYKFCLDGPHEQQQATIGQSLLTEPDPNNELEEVVFRHDANLNQTAAQTEFEDEEDALN